MDEYTIAMTIVLTSIPNDHDDNGRQVNKVAQALRDYADLWARAYEETVEVNRMEEGRRSVTVDDVIPARIRQTRRQVPGL
jgi:hypothetical protein